MRNYLLFCIFLINIILFCAGCLEPKVREYKQTRLLLGTYVSITCLSAQGLETNLILDSAFAQIEKLEKVFSPTLPASEIFQINRRLHKQTFQLSPSTFFVTQKAMEIARVSQGAFDITISPLTAFWKNCVAQNKLPQKAELAAVLKNIGYRHLTLSPQERTIQIKNPAVKIDLGGIAKGYIVDQIAQMLRDNKNIAHAIIDAGGDMYCLGKNIKGRPWQIGIKHPKNKNEILDVLSLTDMAVATSGNYERFFKVKGKQYSHIIHPQTGFPVSSIVSVTIIAPSCLMADGIATAVTVLDKKKGLALIARIAEVEGMIISSFKGERLNISTSANFARYLSSV